MPYFGETWDRLDDVLNADTLDGRVLSDLYERASVAGGGGALTQTQRERIPKRMFVFPEKRAWPIHDLKHAKIALIWSTWPQHKDVAKKVRAAVFKRYPELKKWFKGGKVKENREFVSTQSESLGRLGDVPGLADRLRALQDVIRESESLGR